LGIDNGCIATYNSKRIPAGQARWSNQETSGNPMGTVVELLRITMVNWVPKIGAGGVPQGFQFPLSMVISVVKGSGKRFSNSPTACEIGRFPAWYKSKPRWIT